MVESAPQNFSTPIPGKSIPNVLTVAGSDPSGGAGIQADLKTFAALGTYGCAVITALTAQNTRRVTGVQIAGADFVGLQLSSVLQDLQIDAVKVGMVASSEIARAVAEHLSRWKASAPGKMFVLDPVMVSKSGDRLVDQATVQAIRQWLLPLADVVTPNCHEATVLLDQLQLKDRADMVTAAQRLLEFGSRFVLLKGGGMQSATCDDVLAGGEHVRVLSADRLPSGYQHGAGCTLSSAIAAYAAHGVPELDAIASGKRFVTAAMQHAGRLNVGSGMRPLHQAYAQTEIPAAIEFVSVDEQIGN